jgi:hypothetical protein
VILLAIGDTISGHLFIHGVFASIFGGSPPDDQFRKGLIRAMSTFDHSILFGTFCSIAGIIFLYSEKSALKRAFWTALCWLASLLSLTSAVLMGIFISLVLYAYDRLLKQYRWRWSAFWMLFAVATTFLLFIVDNPMRWIILHLTMEPQHGYYRLMVWGNAGVAIPRSPWLGFVLTSIDEPFLDLSIDSVWLLSVLRYGIPMAVLLFLTNVTACLPAHGSSNSQGNDPYVTRMRTGFTMAIILLSFIGLTVHLWSYMWSFWGMCVGIRASLREQSIVADHVPYRGATALAS